MQRGIEPNYKTWVGNEPDLVPFVVSLNLHRRHLDTDQRAMIAERLANMKQGTRTDLAQNCAMSQAEAARLLNVSERSIRNASKVIYRGVNR